MSHAFPGISTRPNSLSSTPRIEDTVPQAESSAGASRASSFLTCSFLTCSFLTCSHSSSRTGG